MVVSRFDSMSVVVESDVERPLWVFLFIFIIMGSRRGKGTQVPSKTTSDIDLSTAGPSGTTVVLAESIPLEDTEFLAIKPITRQVDT